MNIYKNLLPDEIKAIGLLANEESETMKPMTDYEKIQIMRQQLTENFGKEMSSAFLDKIHMMFNAIVSLILFFKLTNDLGSSKTHFCPLPKHAHVLQ